MQAGMTSRWAAKRSLLRHPILEKGEGMSPWRHRGWRAERNLEHVKFCDGTAAGLPTGDGAHLQVANVDTVEG
jgi:hypothetical protein